MKARIGLRREKGSRRQKPTHLYAPGSDIITMLYNSLKKLVKKTEEK